MSSPPPETAEPDRETGLAFPFLAVGATFGAALAFAGAGAATGYLGGDTAGPLAGAIVSLLAGFFALPPATRTLALLLAWNALGIGGALFAIGIFNVGTSVLVLFPLALLGIALAAWPKREGGAIASGPAITVLVAGFFLTLALALAGTSDLWAGFRAVAGL